MASLRVFENSAGEIAGTAKHIFIPRIGAKPEQPMLRFAPFHQFQQIAGQKNVTDPAVEFRIKAASVRAQACHQAAHPIRRIKRLPGRGEPCYARARSTTMIG